MSVPMKFPCTTVLSAENRYNPYLPLPEMMFRASGVVPPTVLFSVAMSMPSSVLPSAAVPVTSVPMNIAEGKGRESKKEFIHFLYIARGSIYETLTLLEIFQMQGWINAVSFKNLESSAIEIIKMLKGLIKAIAHRA